jgi:outer membrane protein assembly factor BamB
MATLEIHEDGGRVQRVAIARDHTALFGSSQECDIILKGAGILPIHGRIRWKRGRFKVDASPEAKAIERNGKKVSSGSFRIGDEVRLGAFRIFMVNPDDGPVDDKTRVIAPPLASTGFEKSGWFKSLGLAASSSETAVADPEEDDIDKTYDRALREAQTRRDAVARKGRAGTWWRRLMSTLAARDEMPGEERIVTSPLVLGLVGALAVLVVMGVLLRGIIAKTLAQRQYDRAVQSVNDGDFRNAINQLDIFIKANPKDKRVGKALVLRAMSNVQQFALGGNPSWLQALLAARAMVTQVGKEEAYRDESTALGDLVLKTAEGLAERARLEATSKALDDAEQAVKLHRKIVGEAAASLEARSRLPARMDQARSAVRRSESRLAALAAMDEGLRTKSAAAVYAARDRLVAEYSDLVNDRNVVDRLARANDLIREGVSFDESRRPAETEANPEPLGPPTSLVLRMSPDQAPSGGGGPIVYALAQGFAYGLDGATGAPLWHVPVGISSPFPPVAIIGGDPAVLVYDARHKELVRLSGRDGKLIWRQSLEEPVVAAPLVLGNQAIQPTTAGNLLFIDLASGELRGTLKLGRPLSQSPVSDEAGQYLYVLADEANLFVVKRDPLSCTAVDYTGHAAGSLLCPPARVGRYLIVPENNSLGDGRWTVYELLEEGAKVRPVQRVDVPGWTWSSPVSQGSVIWAVGDRGGPIAFAIGEEKVPLQVIAKIGPDSRASGPAFARPRSEREVWISSSRSGRYDLNGERATISPAWTLTDSGPSLGPIQAADRLAVMTQQNLRTPGVALWGIDPNDGAVRWRTVLGAPWPVELAAAPDGKALTTLATDGRLLTIDRASLDKGGFVQEPLEKAGAFRLPPGPLRRIEAEGATLVIPSRDADHILVREGTGPMRTVNLPAPLAAAPLLWGSGLLIPGGDGRVYLIDPKTGASQAEPFVPPFDREHPIHWLAPARLDDETVALADDLGGVRRLALQSDGKPKLVVKSVVNLDVPLATDPVATADAIIVATADGRIRALAARDLSPLGAWPLDAPRALGPVVVSGHTFIADTAGKLLGLGPDGQRLWTIDLKGAPPSGLPIVREDSALILKRDGTLERRSLADGSELGRIPLGILPAGNLGLVGQEVIVPAAPGTVRLLIARDAPKADPRAEK